MQSRRNQHAAKRFFRKLLKCLRYAPQALVTDKLKSYAAAKVQIVPSVEHRKRDVITVIDILNQIPSVSCCQLRQVASNVPR